MPTEEHKVSGKNLLDRVKQIIHEGNVRRITIKNPQGKSLLDIPLTAGVVGAVLRVTRTDLWSEPWLPPIVWPVGMIVAAVDHT